MIPIVSTSLIEFNQIVKFCFQHRYRISHENSYVSSSELNRVVIDLTPRDATH